MDVIDLRILRWKDKPAFSRWVQCHHEVSLKRKAGRSKLREDEVMNEAKIDVMCHKPRNEGSL